MSKTVNTASTLHEQKGFALALLLWMVAALSLLVSGIMSMSRSDVQMTSLQLDQARVQAAATGAGHLLMRDLRLARQAGENAGEMQGVGVEQGIFQREYRLDGMTLSARAIPLTGLISLNSAPPELLADMFMSLGGLPAEPARELAMRVEAWRGLYGSEGHPGMPDDGEQENGQQEEEGHGGFRVLEDLLRVPGMSRALYDRISSAIHAGQTGYGGVDPMAAPAPVLQVLAGGEPRMVDFILESRQDVRAGAEADYAGLRPEFIITGGRPGFSYCLEIDVTIAGTQTYRQRIWVDAGAGSLSTPWRYTRVHPVVARLSLEGR